MDIPIEGEGKAKFNASLKIIETISNLQNIVIEAMVNNDLSMAANVLPIIQNQIDFKLNDTARSELDVLRNNINAELDKIDYPRPNEKIYVDPELNTKIRTLIFEYDRKIRNYQHKAGLGMATEKDLKSVITG